jgi:adenylate cyclase
LSVTVTAIARESADNKPVIATLHQAERRVSGSSVAVAGSARSEITPPASAHPLVDRVAERARAGGLAAEVFDNTSVMVLEFADALLLAERTAEDESATVVDLLVRFLEARAHDLRIDYLRVVGSQVIAASGFGGDPQEGAQRIATLATASQERCTRTFGQLRERSCFRVGLDCGQVLGSPVGEITKGYNLWGPAVQTALAMAHAGVQGEVQATEAVYERLREHFLFKPRGAYYVDGVGRMATYLLSGAL